MEHGMSSYRVLLSNTKAILNLEADVGLVEGEDIIIEDASDTEEYGR